MPILLKDLLNETLSLENKQQHSTPQFKNWFKHSKVVDKSGNPLRVYHGSPKFSGDSFNKSADKLNRTGNFAGFYFSADNDEASNYAGNRDDDGDIYHKEGSSVIPVYLSIQNPYDLGFHGYDPKSVTDKMLDVYTKELQASNSHMDPNNSWFSGKIKQFKTTGKINSAALNYDGDAVQRVIIAGEYDGVIDGEHYIAFDPTQIKSAIGNNGDFNPNDPNIHK
jgi:hypothetical protein